MQPHLWLERFRPPAGLEPAVSRSAGQRLTYQATETSLACGLSGIFQLRINKAYEQLLQYSEYTSPSCTGEECYRSCKKCRSRHQQSNLIICYYSTESRRQSGHKAEYVKSKSVPEKPDSATVRQNRRIGNLWDFSWGFVILIQHRIRGSFQS